MCLHLTGAALCATLLAACSQTPSTAPGTDQETLRARGNEPFWSLRLEGERLQWQTPEQQLTGRLRAQASASGTRLVGQLDGHDIEVRTQGRVCHDSMSGMPYPYEVLVLYQAHRYPGCGGEPATMLQGAWRVTELEGGLPPGAQLTLQFDAQGQVSGHAGCNRYSSRYTLSGEGLRIAPLAATRMACPPPRMDVEGRYLRQLEAVQGFDVDGSGALLLLGPQGQRIVARRP